MRRRVEEAVRRQDPVDAAAPHPVVRLPALRPEVHELHPGPRGQDVLLRRLAPVAPVVEPVRVHVGIEPDLHLSGARIAADEGPLVGVARDLPCPDEAAGDEEVLLGLVPRGRVGSLPEDLPIDRREAPHGPVPAREEDDVLVDDEVRAEADLDRPPPGDGLGGPPLPAGLPIEGDDPLPVVEQDPAAAGGEGHGGDGGLVPPADFPGRRIDGDDRPFPLVPGPLPVRPAGVVPDVGEALAVLRPPGWIRADEDVEDPIRMDDLLGVRRPLAGPERLPRRRVQRGHRGVEPEGDVDLAAAGDQPAGDLRGAALQGPAMGVPGGDRPPPELHAARGIAGDEAPVRREQDGGRRSLIEDGEDPASGGDEGAHARHVVVMARPSGPSDPLIAPRGPDDRVAGHGIPRRVVEEVRPLVDRRGAGLDGARPAAIAPGAGDPAGGEDPEDLGLGDRGRVLADEEVDDVIGVGEAPPAPSLHGDLPFEAQRADMGAGGVDPGGIALEGVDEEALPGPESGGEPAVAGSDQDDQAAPDPGGVQDLPGNGLRGAARARRGGREQDQGAGGEGSGGDDRDDRPAGNAHGRDPFRRQSYSGGRTIGILAPRPAGAGYGASSMTSTADFMRARLRWRRGSGPPTSGASRPARSARPVW
jgi:hypothetical protein